MRHTKTRWNTKDKHKKYGNLQKIIRQVIKDAKEKWMKSECEELKELRQKHYTLNIHRKVKEIGGIHKRILPMTLVNEQLEMI